MNICPQYQDMVLKAKASLSGTWAEGDKQKPMCMDKSAKALSAQGRYCAEMLTFFTVYFWEFSITMWVEFVWKLVFQDCHSASCHCWVSSEWGCSRDNQMSKHALHGLRCRRMKTISVIYAT